MRKLFYVFLFAAMTTVMTPFHASASQWQQAYGYWLLLGDDGEYVRDTWIQENGKWYYMDVNGVMLTDHLTPDGKYVNEDGEYVDSAHSGIDEAHMAELSMAEPLIIFNKASHYLQYWANGVKLHECLGTCGRGEGDKEIEGDGKTPEGEFYVCFKKPDSSEYKAFAISYPNIEDANRGLTTGLITPGQYASLVDANNRKATPNFYTPLGGWIEIHGKRPDFDNTFGCIGLTNQDIDILWNIVPVRTKVIIVSGKEDAAQEDTAAKAEAAESTADDSNKTTGRVYRHEKKVK